MRHITKLMGISMTACLALVLVSASSLPLLSSSRDTVVADNGADVPTWETGNYWAYDIDIGYEAGSTSADVNIADMRFEVTSVETETYTLNVEGTMTGTVSIAGIIEGRIQNTDLSGKATVRKADLALEQLTDIHIDGEIQRTLTTNDFQADLALRQNVTPVVSPHDFPITVNETWTVPLATYWLFLDAEVALAVPYGVMYDFPLYVEDHTLECTGINDITVPAGTYQAYHVTDSGYEYWYAAAAGNVVLTAYQDIRFWYNESLYWEINQLNAELVETNFQPYSDPPYSPANPDPSDGATNVSVETMLQWDGGDPDGDTVTYDVYLGTSLDPPLAAAGIPDTTFDPAGLQDNTTYQWRIVARDQYGYETNGSLWTFTTEISINTAPNVPSRPSGPSTGNTGIRYTYTSSTTDPDGDDIYYLFDWGDGTDSGWLGPYHSGDTIAGSYTWSNDGNYSIRVKAKDIAGAETGWSDPLGVSMPVVSRHVENDRQTIHISYLGIR